ncbi:hypothetical protein L1887_23498 [Cichorium endivia]|nr:hypothetical protein L1887_23498 [Cichorium endivia]
MSIFPSSKSGEFTSFAQLLSSIGGSVVQCSVADPLIERFASKGFSFTFILSDFHFSATGGLQFRHKDQWVNVPFVPGAFVVKIRDLLQASGDLQTTFMNGSVAFGQVYSFPSENIINNPL